MVVDLKYEIGHGQILTQRSMNLASVPEHNEIEWRVLQAVKQVLTQIARETAVPPGTRHPLSPSTIESMKQCMGLISARERDLIGNESEVSSMRPRYPDQSTRVSVPLSDLVTSKPDKTKN